MIRLRCACFLLLLLGVVAGSAKMRATVPAFRVQGLGQPTVTLDGPWQFHLGDDPRWASPDLDDTGWERLQVDKGWGAQGHFAYQGFGWYRRHIEVAQNQGPSGHLWLSLPAVQDVYEVYWQGRLIGGMGKLPPHASWSQAVVPTSYDLGPPASGTLAIRVWRAPLLSYDSGQGGGLNATPKVGTHEALIATNGLWSYERLKDVQIWAALTLLYGLVMVAALVAWAQHKQRPLLLWVGLFALANVLQAGWWHVLLDIPYRAEGALAGLVYQPLEDISTWFILLYLLDLRGDVRLMRWTYRVVWAELILCFADGIAVLCWADGWPQWTDMIVSELVLIPELFAVVLVVVAIVRRKRLPMESWLVAAFALLTDLFLEGGAFLSQENRFTHWTFWKYFLRPALHIAGVGVLPVEVMGFCFVTALVAAMYRYAMTESLRERSLENEFHSAQELQRVLIPEDLPSIHGYEVTSAYRPASEVGGDFFQLLPQGGGSALLVVGDVSGKGLAAAMAVSLIVGTIRTLAEQLPSPTEMLAGINRRLVGKLQGGFATCVVALLKPDGTVHVASAGHPGPYLNGAELELPAALPLGISLDLLFEERRALLQVGDHLTLYSDGLIEARQSDTGALFGFDRVQAIAAGCAQAGDFADAAVAFGQEDDITVVTVTRLRVGAESRTSITAPELVTRTAQAF